MKPITFKPNDPIKWKGNEYDELTFRVPTYGDMKKLDAIGVKADEDPGTAMKHVLAYAEILCTTVEGKALTELTYADAQRLAIEVMPLFGVTPVGGVAGGH